MLITSFTFAVLKVTLYYSSLSVEFLALLEVLPRSIVV